MPLRIRPNGRAGLLPWHRHIAPTIRHGLQLTVPVREALTATGAAIIPDSTTPTPTWSVILGPTIPPGIIATRISGWDGLALRLDTDPEYPGEIGHAAWEQVDWTPCPICGAPLVWYEAGYVPGYRVCTRPPHHHAIAR